MKTNILDNKNVFIFDLDGTLIDSISVWNKIDATFIRKTMGAEIDEDIIFRDRDRFLANCKEKNPYVEYVKYLKKKYYLFGDIDDLVNFRIHITREMLSLIELKPYAIELLTLLKKLNKTLVLSTTGAKTNVERILYSLSNTMELGNNLFDLVLDQSCIKNLKPSPEIHLNAQKTLGFKSDEAVIIEDSYMGLNAAKNAFIDCVIVYDKYNEFYKQYLVENADLYVQSLKDVYDLVPKLTK